MPNQKKSRATKTPVREPEGLPEAWMQGDGEGWLAVDVIDGDKVITVRSAIAGVKPDDLEVFVHNDILTIRGSRESQREETNDKYLVRECHWGIFSRSIILPSEVDADAINATIKNGVLTITLPKIERSRRITIKRA